MCTEKKVFTISWAMGVDTWFKSKVEDNQENTACRTFQEGGQ